MEVSHKDTFLNIRRDVLIYLFLIITTLACYWQVRNHEFVNYDDPMFVSENPHVQAGLSWDGITYVFTNIGPTLCKLALLSHMLDCQFFGLDPGLHHLTSLLFHIANTVLLFLVLSRMTGAFWRSAFVAAMFALHPLNVESVAWVADRKNVLSTFFWILTMLSYFYYVDRPGLYRYLLVSLFFILGLMSKMMVITMPFVLLLLDYWPLGRFKKASSAFHLIWEKVPLFALTAASCVVTFIGHQEGGGVSSLQMLSLQSRIGNTLISYVGYIGKMIWPMNLSVYYPYRKILPWWQVAGACLLFASISLLAIRYTRRKPYFIVGWLWYIGTLVPVIGLVQIGAQAMADRYAYVPLIGIFIMIAWGIPELVSIRQKRKIVLTTIAAALLVGLMATTWIQVRYWRNSIALFEHALDVTTGNSLAHYNLAYALDERGEVDEAIHHYSETVRIDPYHANAHINLGNLLEFQGRHADAIRHYMEALRIDPDNAGAHSNLGNILAKQGRITEAIWHYSEALRKNPDSPGAHNNLGNALVREGKIAEAIRHYMEALRIDPEYANAHYNLGAALAREGKIEDAIVHFREALRIRPGDPETRKALEMALAAKKKMKKH